MMKVFNFILILTALFAAMIVMVGSLILSSQENALRIDDATRNMNLLNDEVFGQSFRILSVGFFNRTLISNVTEDPCLNPKSAEIIILKLEFNVDMMPDKCQVYIDDSFGKELSNEEFDCKPQCTGYYYPYSVDLKKTGVFSEHDIDVCCDSICSRRILGPLCD